MIWSEAGYLLRRKLTHYGYPSRKNSIGMDPMLPKNTLMLRCSALKNVYGAYSTKLKRIEGNARRIPYTDRFD